MSVTSVAGLNFSKINYTPSFKNNSVTLPPQKADTVEISIKNKKSQDGISPTVKKLLGITGGIAAIYGLLVGHRALSRPTLEVLQKDLSEIFRRNVSKEDIQEMLKKYQDILKINDEKDFCQKAFEQIKKDYGYEHLNIKPTLNDSTDSVFAGQWKSTGDAFFIYYKNIIKICGGKFNKLAKARIIDSIFHEFQHVKQTEYCVRTDLDKYVNGIIKDEALNKIYLEYANNILKNEKHLEEYANSLGMPIEPLREQLINERNILKEKGYKALPALVKQVNNDKEIIKANLNTLFNKYEKFKPNTEEYKLGETYIENFDKYIEAQKDSKNTEYLNQTIEKEAFNAENLSLDIPKRLKSIWNIFDITNYNILKVKES